MEYNYRNCNSEVVVKLIGRLTTQLPHLEVDLPLQLDVKRTIEEVLYNYEVTSKETALVTSDIDGKINYFLATKKLEGLSPLSIKNYEYTLRKFGNFFNKPLSTITNADIKMYLYSITEGRQASSLNTIMIPIRLFFSWAQNEEFIIKNPCSSIKPVKEPKRMKSPLSIENVELLRDSLTELREKAIFEFFISTGCRLAEVREAKISDIDFNNKTLLVIGKGNKQRRVYFTERCKRALINYINSRTDSCEYLFIREKAPYTKLGSRGYQDIVKAMKKKSGIPSKIKVTPHIFRHTFATHALNAGMKIDVVQHLLGHVNPSTTQTYAKLMESNIEHTYRQLIS